MNAVLEWAMEHYCFTCEEPLTLDNYDMDSLTRAEELHCPQCGAMYEYEIPTTGNDYPILRMTGYGGEWQYDDV